VCAAALLCACLLGHRAARAQGPVTPIVVHRSPQAAQCPDANAIASAVNRLVGRNAVDPLADGDVGILVDVTKAEIGYAATVRSSGKAKGLRELRDDTDSCSGLAEALSLTIALIIDTMDRPTEKVAVERPVQRKQASEEGSASLAAELDLAGAADLLHSLRLASMGGADVSTRRGHSVGLGWIGTQSYEAVLAPGHVDMSLWAVVLRACGAAVSQPRVKLLLCGLPAAGSMHASASGYSRNGAVTRPWLALGGEVAAVGKIAGPLQWALRSGALVTLREETFTIQGLGDAYETPRVGGFIAVGLRVSIW
jgi:hypothetical protein